MTRSRLTDLLLYTLSGFTLLSLAAATLLVLHGLGYGRHELPIFLLGLPASIVLPLIPDILLASHTSLFNVVALPWMINIVLTLTFYLAARPFTASVPDRPNAHSR